ncbi:hypothetical protein [Streptomyces sp. NPDC059708]|uniref:hypothetical protein n=1 Tax=Streptomyces sp. NPDC059708 TaxID=3346916 RepID=UPI00367A6F1C
MPISLHKPPATARDRTLRRYGLPQGALLCLLFCTAALPVLAIPLSLGGLIAVTAYDMLRLPVIRLCGWPDFIPRLGQWVTGADRPDAAVGYLWRYIGDGGGIGMAFSLFCLVVGVRRGLVPLGLAYGVFIWSGLICTLLLVPHAQLLLFRLTPATLAVSLAGHLVYGSTLGWCVGRFDGRYRFLAAPAVSGGR